VLGFSLLEGILLGAIISSTDAAAVFAILRGRGVNLRGRLKPLLELESGSNDPMAIFLTVGMIQLLADPTLPVTALIPLFVLQMGVGALVGLVAGRAMVTVINRLRLDYDGLYPVLTIAFVMLIYGAAAVVGGSGFLAVYLAGLVMGQFDFIHRRSLTQFHDGLAWLMQIVMFVTLGLLVFPSELPSVAGEGLAVALFLIFVARPVSVWIGLAFARVTLREKHFIAWVGLRGAAPIVLATFPLVAGLDKADTIFNLVFFIVLMSVLFQGTLIVPVARLLKVYGTRVRQPVSPLSQVLRDGAISNDLIEITVPPASPAVGQRLLDLKLPPGALVVLIGRKDNVMVPNGSTEILANDHVLILATNDVLDAVTAQLEQSLGYPRLSGSVAG
jgi:cell volume regulation protein A